MTKKTELDKAPPVAVRIMAASELTPDANNANRGNSRGRQMVKDSFKRLKAGRSIVLDRDGRVIAGNKSLEAYMANGGERVIVIPSDGDYLIAHQRQDLDLEEGLEARELAFADNRTAQVGIEFDPVRITDAIQVGVDLTPYWSGHELDQLFQAVNSVAEETGPAVDEDGIAQVDDIEDVEVELEGALQLRKDMRFPSEAVHDIPEFLPGMLAEIPEPLRTWAGDDVMEYDPAYYHLLTYGYGFRGVNVRRAVMSFYVDDDKFENVWFDPDIYVGRLLNLGIPTCVSPNFSLWSDAPEATNIYQTYRARWVGRYMQEAGLKLIPDVNWCDERSFRYCFAGIPQNPPAISIQVQTASEPDEIAVLLTGITSAINVIKPQSMLIYGGGNKIKERIATILPRQLYTVWVENRSAVRRPHITNRGM